MQQAAFEGAKQNEMLRTTMRINFNNNLDNLCQQLALESISSGARGIKQITTIT